MLLLSTYNIQLSRNEQLFHHNQVFECYKNYPAQTKTSWTRLNLFQIYFMSFKFFLKKIEFMFKYRIRESTLTIEKNFF